MKNIHHNRLFFFLDHPNFREKITCTLFALKDTRQIIIKVGTTMNEHNKYIKKETMNLTMVRYNI
ncbi:hypothetical protein Hanom_Chr14g01265671 [Helianthus anomalus]